jgi:hypothetical protein
MKTVNIEEIRYRANAGIDLRQVVYGVISFVVVCLLLNASALEKNATLMEFGIMRNVCMAVIHPVSVVSSFLHVDLFRNWIENLSVIGGK